MSFTRFGNAFIAEHNGTLYVVSFYMQVWQAYYRDFDGNATLISSHGTFSDAIDAARHHAKTGNVTQ